MGRPLRIVLPDYSYHLIARGNERKNIFKDGRDKKMMQTIIEEAKKKYDFLLFAYVLMDNHYHLLVKIKRKNLSRIMQYINTSYGIYFNRKYKRSGHLFQGRFKSVIVEHGQDIKHVARYIHLNPIRAGIVETLPEFKWSSHRQFTGLQATGIADPEHVLRLFDNDLRAAISKYEKYITEVDADNDDDRILIHGNYVLGSEGFVKDIKLIFRDKDLSHEIDKRASINRVYDAAEISKAAAMHLGIDEVKLRTDKGKWNTGKRLLIYLLKKDAGMLNTEISAFLSGIHPSGISKIYAKVCKEVEENRVIRETVEGIECRYKVNVEAGNLNSLLKV